MSEAAARLTGLSCCLPAFNEAGNLRPLLEEALQLLPTVAEQFEVIVVNDGSWDNTGAIADEVARQGSHVRVVHHARNVGYGGALLTGFRHAQYEWIFFTDADRQFALPDLRRFVPLSATHDVICGYRQPRRDPWVRRLYAWLFNRCVRMGFKISVRDVNCAFKLFRRRLLTGLSFTAHGALVNTELLCKIAGAGGTIAEVPVQHFPRQRGRQTGGTPRVILRAAREYLQLWVTIRCRPR